MRRWMMLAAAGLLGACGSPGDPQDEGAGGDATPEVDIEDKDKGKDEDTSTGGEACSEGALEQCEAIDDEEGEGDQCREVCAEAVAKGCDWVGSICDLATSVDVGGARLPCMVAELAACTAAASSPLICEVLCALMPRE